MEINICNIYPDMLNLYGDRGNVLCLKKRMEKMGIRVNVFDINLGQSFNAENYDIFIIGGGQDFEQDIITEDAIKHKKYQLISAIERGKTVLAICGGYQLLGQYYQTKGKKIEGISALDFYTNSSKTRMIGNFALVTDEGIEIVGFENHSGKTFLGKGLKPLGKLIEGNGNNGIDNTEGLRYKNTFCSYSHGPVLPKNPRFADLLIKSAVENKYGNCELEKVDDTLENKDHDYVMKHYI